jgi:hypothetical protein
MKHFITLIIILLCSSITARATVTDSLERLISEKQLPAEKRIEILIDLSKNYLPVSVEKAVEYGWMHLRPPKIYSIKN